MKTKNQLKRASSLGESSQNDFEDTHNSFMAANIFVDKFTLQGKGGRHRYISSCGKYVYNLAIIDYL